MNTTRDTRTALRTPLLDLHRALSDSERIVYERSAGAIPSQGAFLQLLAHDPWFEWLRPLSSLIAETDAALNARGTVEDDHTLPSLLRQIRSLLAPDENGDGFPRFYHDAIQNNPAVLIAHGAVVSRLAA